MPLQKCSRCQKEVHNLLDGNCAGCKYENTRTGNQIAERKVCSAKGCTKFAVTKGLCDKHYHRLWRRGSADSERYERWGHASSHPMYHRWQNFNRGREPVVAEWKDFWVFVKDVGEPPTSTHRVYRVDKSQPYGPRNFEWRARRTDIPLTSKNEYMRAYRLQRPRENKNDDLKKLYGITVDDFEAMKTAQNNLCAICNRPERRVDKKTQQISELAVDHNHVSGKVRGLLCSGCNTSLGSMNDNPELLRAAADYLDRHKRTQEVPE